MTIYFDNSATTPVDPAVLEAMMPYFKEKYANPSSIHTMGRQIKSDLVEARTNIADTINADVEEIIFTASGSESDNLAIKGIAMNNKNKGKHIITSSIEHKAVSETCRWLSKLGFDITYLPVDSNGVVDLQALATSIRSDTILITIMLANNELGTIQPLKEICEIAKDKGIIVHTDAVQAIGKMKVDVIDLGVDLLTFSGHKIYAPKGIGILYINEKLKNNLMPLVHGGSHEFGLRAGTENVPYIIGLSKACQIIKKNLDDEIIRIGKLRDSFESQILKEITYTYVNGAKAKRVCNVSNLTFKYIEGEALMVYASEVCCSTGSACSSESEETSHVLRAINLDPIDLHGTLRFSFGRFNTIEEVKKAVSIIKSSVSKLRAFSPLYNKKESN
mgnify:CR=1 FL=1